ncbi:hypothetical protein BDAP_002067 [Binucleata daphniae]
MSANSDKDENEILLAKVKSFHSICLEGNYKQKLNNVICTKNYDAMRQILEKQLRFSTGGIRSNMAYGLENINEITINLITTAVVSYIKIKKKPKKAYLGYDGRQNSLFYAAIVCQIMHANQIIVYLAPKPVISPFVPTAVLKLEADIGIMITASHNDKTYNGMKMWLSDGYQINNPHDTKILELLQKHKITSIDYFGYEINNNSVATFSIKDIKNTEQYDFDDLLHHYSLSLCKDLIEPKNINNHDDNKKILFSPMFGASKQFLENALSCYNLEDVMVCYEPHCVICPDFGGCKYPNPELEENFSELIDYANKNKINYIIMTDPDGDRFSLAQNINSKWKIYDADEIAAIFAYFYMLYYDKKDLVFINTFYCNDLLNQIADDEKIEHYKTETGFKNIAQNIKEIREQKSDKVFFCYEDALGFLHMNGTEKDGIASTVIITKLINEGKCMHEILQLVYETYGRFSACKRRYRVENTTKKMSDIAQILKHSDYKKSKNKIEVRIESNAKVIFRASETEPMIKLYAHSKGLCYEELKRKIEDFIAKLHIDNEKQ